MFAVYLVHLVACAVLSVPLGWLLARRWRRWRWFHRTVMIELLTVLWFAPVLIIHDGGADCLPGTGSMVYSLINHAEVREAKTIFLMAAMEGALLMLVLYLPVSFAWRVAGLLGWSCGDPRACQQRSFVVDHGEEDDPCPS